MLTLALAGQLISRSVTNSVMLDRATKMLQRSFVIGWLIKLILSKDVLFIFEKPGAVVG